MKRLNEKLIYLLLIAVIFLSCSSLTRANKTHSEEEPKIMETIKFIPKEFNEVELGYYQTSVTPCTPGYPDSQLRVNTMLINVPQKVIYNLAADSLAPVIPLSGLHSVSSRRSLKYHDLSAKVIHINKVDEDSVFTGEIKEPYVPHKITPTWNRGGDREEQILEAQKYSDQELDESQAIGSYINLNIMEYVDMPFLPGKYEVWMTYYGLESNHCIVEIIAE